MMIAKRKRERELERLIEESERLRAELLRTSIKLEAYVDKLAAEVTGLRDAVKDDENNG